MVCFFSSSFKTLTICSLNVLLAKKRGRKYIQFELSFYHFIIFFLMRIGSAYHKHCLLSSQLNGWASACTSMELTCVVPMEIIKIFTTLLIINYL